MKDQFIRERTYMKGVSEHTWLWYQDSFEAFQGASDSKTAIVQRIGELMKRGVKLVSINTYLRCINAYLRWLHVEHGQPLLTIPRLKEEHKVLATFSPEQVKTLLNFKPKGRNQARAHVVCCVVLDTGLRIAEALAGGPRSQLYPLLPTHREGCDWGSLAIGRYSFFMDSHFLLVRTVATLARRQIALEALLQGKGISIENIAEAAGQVPIPQIIATHFPIASHYQEELEQILKALGQ